MLFRPNPGSGVPIYLQLMEQVRHAVETGALREGEHLPGIRKVAEDLVINPNTVAKAYRELELKGVISSERGNGSFVKGASEPAKLPEAERQARLESFYRRMLAEAAGYGVSENELIQYIIERK